jgi:hypothetical protein
MPISRPGEARAPCIWCLETNKTDDGSPTRMRKIAYSRPPCVRRRGGLRRSLSSGWAPARPSTRRVVSRSIHPIVIASEAKQSSSCHRPKSELFRGACHLYASATSLVGGAHPREQSVRKKEERVQTGRPRGAPLRHVDPVGATLVVALLRCSCAATYFANAGNAGNFSTSRASC